MSYKIPSEIKEKINKSIFPEVRLAMEQGYLLASKTIDEKDKEIGKRKKESDFLNEKINEQASTIASLEAENKELKEQYSIMDGRRERAIKSLEESEKQFEQLQEAYNKLIGS